MGEPQHTVRMQGGFRVMRHHEQGAILVTDQAGEQRHHPGSRFFIQIPSGFIGKDQERIMHEGTRQCHALLFTTGEFFRKGIPAIEQSNGIQQLARLLRGSLDEACD